MSTSTGRGSARGRSVEPAPLVAIPVVEPNQRSTRSTRSMTKPKIEVVEKKETKSQAKKKVIVKPKSKKAVATPTKGSEQNSRRNSRSASKSKSKSQPRNSTSKSKSPNTSATKNTKGSRNSSKMVNESATNSAKKKSNSKSKTTSTKRKSDQITSDKQDDQHNQGTATKRAHKTNIKPAAGRKSTGRFSVEGEELIDMQPKKGATSSSKKARSSSKYISRPPAEFYKQVKYIIRLDITLLEVNIPITRQILVSTEISFARLARIIVASMGWKGYHDWMFVFKGDEIYTPVGNPDDEEKNYGDTMFLDQYKITIGTVFDFVYNLECKWKHSIKVTDFHESPTKGQYERGNPVFNPVILEGKNSCPPDEVEGGAEEYNKMLEIFRTETPVVDYENLVDLYGKDYNAYDFKKKIVNDLLKNFPYEDKFDTTKSDHDDLFLW